MSVALIIPTYNRLSLLKKIVDCVRRQTVPPSYFIVVDDGSTDGTSEFLDENSNWISVVRGNGDLWWTGAVNAGIKYALNNCKDINGVVLLNDDVHVDENWFSNLISDVGDRNNILMGCVNVNLEDKDTITWCGKSMNTWFAIANYFYRGKSYREVCKTIEIKSFDLIGRGVYIPISVFEKIGLFDQKMFKHCGDTELPLRARYAGYKLLVSLDSVVYDMPEETFSIDKKTNLTVKDFKMRFFDFRSNAYWKYRWGYAKIVGNGNPFKTIVFFTCRMMLHLCGFVYKCFI